MDPHSFHNNSAVAQPNEYRGFSPEGSLMELDFLEHRDHSLSSRASSPSDQEEGGSPSSDLQAFVLQEYSMPILTAYGLATAHQSSKSNAMRPYPKTTPPLDTGEHKTSVLSQTSCGHKNAPPSSYFVSQAIRDCSAAFSSSFQMERAPPPSQENYASRMSHEWSTKNKLNLTVDTNVLAVQHYGQLPPHYRDSLTPCSDSGNSPLSQFAPSLLSESNYSTHHAAAPSPSQPNVLDWLTANNQYQYPNSAGANFESLPTPSSATFSALPTPTTEYFPTDFAYCSTEKSMVDFGRTPSAIPSPPIFELATSFGPLTHSVVPEQLSMQPYPLAFFSDYSQSLNEPDSKTQSEPYDHSSIFGHIVSSQALCGQLSNTSLHSSNRSLTSVSPQPTDSMVTTDCLNNSSNSSRNSSPREMASCGEPPCKKRRSRVSTSLQKENIDPFSPRSSSFAKLAPAPRGTLGGSRLKPGPKAKSTVIQHPPPGANLIGLNPSQEASGIPKDVLKCLYEVIADSDQLHRDEIPTSNKRYLCKLDGCGRIFPRKTAIESHLQTHLEDKPFVCDVKDCNAAFVRQHDLRRHQQVHSGSKPFSCICGKGFARGDALMRHRQRGICAGSLVPKRC